MLMGALALVSGRECVCVCTIYLDFSDTTKIAHMAFLLPF